MALYGYDDLVVEFDNSAGALQNMSQYVTSIGPVIKEAITEESHAAGDSWVEHLFAGIRRMSPITIGGFYDDTATTGPNAIFDDVGVVAGPAAGTRTLAVTYGSTKKTTVETIIMSYTRTPTRNETTKFEVVVQPTGAPTEA